MKKVQITLFGKQALVDSDQVKFHSKKESLVKQAVFFEKKIKNETNFEERHQLGRVLNEVMVNIIQLNRRIRKNVTFIKENNNV